MADNEITADQLQTISDYLTGTCEVDFREDEDGNVFRTDYSGRGMYGRSCIGLVVDSEREMFQIAMNLAEALIRCDADYELVEAFKNPTTDSMGRGMILYWTNIALAEPEDGEDEEELADDAELPASERQLQ